MKRTDRRHRSRTAIAAIVVLSGTLLACGSDGDDAVTTDAVTTDAVTETAAPETTEATPATTEAAPQTTEAAPETTEASVEGISGAVTDFEFGAGDYYFDTKGVTELSAGTIRATMTVDDVSTEAHVAMFARVKEGETIESVLTAAETDFTGYQAAQMVDFYGGVNALNAGETQSSLITLTPGTYVLACFIPAQDGSFPPKPHSALGMWSEITVTEPEEPAAEVENDGTITMTEMEFGLPDGFDGNGIFEVENNGELLHEMGIVVLDEAKTGEDVAAFYDFSKGPPALGQEPDTPSGGFAANHPGNDGYVELDLSPGNYVLVCFVGNEPPSFSTHLNEGMWKEFTVT